MTANGSASGGLVVTPISSLIWPKEEPKKISIECAGQSYLNYVSLKSNRRSLHIFSSIRLDASKSATSSSTTATANDKKKKGRNLLTLPSTKLSKLTYYQVLGDIPMHSTADEIKRAYHKCCLKYHPDKTGRGEEDEVFLLVKTAFDTLSDRTKRKSYDSTVDFDESIPRGGEGKDIFYDVYGPVFRRNLRFDSRFDPCAPASAAAAGGGGGGGGGGKNKKKRKNKKNKSSDANSSSSKSGISCPDFGDDDTPIAQVNAFYDYWANFESWRDFTLVAASQTEHDVESADCREEKRWMAREIERKAKQMKRDEMSRITTLVERAMAADPRLKRERERERREKEGRERERREKEAERKRSEEEERVRVEKERERKEKEEKEKRANAKVVKEKEKKALRKARQLLRRLVLSAYKQNEDEAVWSDMESMNDDIELLCSSLSLQQITSLTDLLNPSDTSSQTSFSSSLKDVSRLASEVRDGATRQGLADMEARKAARAESDRKAELARAAKLSSVKVWTRDELSALAKGVKKFPPGGSNRWDSIASFVSNVSRNADDKGGWLRTKEECIEKYNQIASGSGPGVAVASSTPSGEGGSDSTASTSKVAAGSKVDAKNPRATASKADAKKSKNAASKADTKKSKDNESGWTDQQDKQLQEGLAKYPSTMDKNERWTSIAKGVEGKNKKECVQRFKAIRDAIKKK